MAVTVTINGTDVTDYYLSYQKTIDTDNGASLIEIAFKKTIDSVLTLAIGDVVNLIRDSSYRVRNGEIYTILKRRAAFIKLK